MPKRSTRGSRLFYTLLVFLWLGGIALLAYLTPVGLREGWQPRNDEYLVGLLSDGVTAVTIPLPPTLWFDPVQTRTQSGPIKLWNVHSGKLIAQHRDSQFRFDRLLIAPKGLLQIIEPWPDDQFRFHLRLVDAHTGVELQCYESINQQKNIWWMITPDGTMSIFQTYEGKKSFVEVRNNTTGQLIRRIEGWRESLKFSPDGTIFFAHDEARQDYGVFSTKDGELLHRVVHEKRRDVWHNRRPIALSPDNTLLLDDEGNVWDVCTSEKRYRVPRMNSNCLTFTPDGRYIVSLIKDKNECVMKWFDSTTGKEVESRRTSAATGDQLYMNLQLAPHRSQYPAKYMLVEGQTGTEQIANWKKWLQQFAWLHWLNLNDVKFKHEYVLVEIATGTVKARGTSALYGLTPLGDMLIVRQNDQRLMLGNLPLSKPWRFILLICMTWTCVFLAIVVWCTWKNAMKHQPGDREHDLNESLVAQK